MKIKSVNDKGVNAIGTSYQGTIDATKNELMLVLGQPIERYKDLDRDGKVCFEWIIKLDNGNVATVYDWKLEYVIDDITEYQWHIGCKKSDFVEFKKSLEASISYELAKRFRGAK